jgi:ankyrin repeat protein
MTLKDIEEVKKQITKYMCRNHGYWRVNTNEVGSIVSQINKLTFKQRSQLVNNPIEFEKQPNCMQKFKTSILSLACLRNDLNLAEFLIKNCGADTETIVSLDEYELWDNITFYTAVSQIDGNKYSSLFSIKAPVLWHSCRGSSLAMVRTLVENGADVNSKTETILNSTPLMAACAKNRLDVVQYLVEKGANIHEKNKYDETCLFYAVRHNEQCLKLITYLISLGLDMNSKNKFNKTILNFSVDLHNSNIMLYLMNNNYRLFDMNIIGSALMSAAVNGKKKHLNNLIILKKLNKRRLFYLS